MDVFTSKEVNRADISQERSAAFTFSGSVDSKGRITIPARIRDRLDLKEGDEVSLSLSSTKVIVEEVDSYQEALDFIQALENVEIFSYSKGVVEVVLDE